MENKSTMWIVGIAGLVLVGGIFLLANNNSKEMEEKAKVAEEQEAMEEKAMETEKEMMEKEEAMEAEQTIVEIAASNPDFSTLVTAVQEAGLVEALSGAGPFTVFAPTNAAFAALPAGTLDAVLADKEQLTSILTYHVVPGKVMAKDVVNLSEADTLQGSKLVITTTDDGSVMINGAKVTTVDIPGSNGVIHVIDAVLLPPTE